MVALLNYVEKKGFAPLRELLYYKQKETCGQAGTHWRGHTEDRQHEPIFSC